MHSLALFFVFLSLQVQFCSALSFSPTRESEIRGPLSLSALQESERQTQTEGPPPKWTIYVGRPAKELDGRFRYNEGFEKSEELGIEDEEEMDMYILHHYSPGEKSDYDSAAALNHVGLGFERLSLDPSDERRKFHAHIYMSNPRGGGFPDLGGEFPIPEGKDKLNWLAVPLIAIQEGWGQKFWQRKAKLGKLKGWQFNALGCFFRKYLATLQRFNLHTLVMEAPEQKGKETDIVYRSNNCYDFVELTTAHLLGMGATLDDPQRFTSIDKLEKNPIPYTTYGWITEQRPQKVTETDEAPTERVVAFYDQLIKTAKSISVVSPMEVDFEQDLSKRYRATHSVFSKIAEKLFDEGVEADERMNEKADALPVEVDKGSQKIPEMEVEAPEKSVAELSAPEVTKERTAFWFSANYGNNFVSYPVPSAAPMIRWSFRPWQFTTRKAGVFMECAVSPSPRAAVPAPEKKAGEKPSLIQRLWNKARKTGDTKE